jgi:hypothetical protein
MKSGEINMDNGPDRDVLHAAEWEATAGRDPLGVTDGRRPSLPSDIRKFDTLYTTQNSDPAYKPLFLKCPEETDDAQVILHAFHASPFSRNCALMAKCLMRLSKIIAKRMNEVVEAFKRRSLRQRHSGEGGP